MNKLPSWSWLAALALARDGPSEIAAYADAESRTLCVARATWRAACVAR